jgi:hypothetical protein
MLVIKEA